jgi:hypothetical protein
MWVVLAVLGPLAAFVAWRVLTMGLSDMAVDSDSQRALFWRADNPDAILSAANDDFVSHDYAGSKSMSLDALSRYPLNGIGYEFLGRNADFFHDPKTARRLFQLAERFAPREVATRGKLADYALKDGNVDGALYQVDTLLRMHPEVMADIMPSLVQLSAFPVAQGPIGKVLAKRPQWRIAFLSLLASAGGDPKAIDRIFAVRGGDDPLPAMPPRSGVSGPDADAGDDDLPTGFTEADLLINRQLADGRWQAAHATWIASLSDGERAVSGKIYDGNFVFPPAYHRIPWLNLSHKGFGWQLPDQGSGYDLAISPRSQFQSQSVLQITFNGLPIDYQPVSQLLVLPPGHYRFKGMGQAGGMTTEVGLQWVVACARDNQALFDQDQEQVLGHSTPFQGEIPYSAFSFEFDVPEPGATPPTQNRTTSVFGATASIATSTDCGAQQLRLDLGSGLFKGIPLQGGAIFDHLDVERIATKPTTPPL